MTSAAATFETHELTFLSQFKSYFFLFAQNLCESQGAIARVVDDYQNCVQQVDVPSILRKFVEAKGTGTERPSRLIRSKHFSLVFAVFRHHSMDGK